MKRLEKVENCGLETWITDSISSPLEVIFPNGQVLYMAPHKTWEKNMYEKVQEVHKKYGII